MMTQEAQHDMTRNQSLRDEKAKDQPSTARQPRERDLMEQVQFTASDRQDAEPQAEIDERRRGTTNLRRGDLRSGQLAESIQAIPWEADAATFHFLFVGQQAAAILGYAVEDWLMDDFWTEHLHPDDRLEIIEHRRRAIARGESHQSEYRMIHLDGGVVWIHDIVNVVKEAGFATKLGGFMLDFTARHKAEEEAQDYLRQLARMNRAASMGEMVASLAHEVNQPLTAIVINAQAAARLLRSSEPDVAEVCRALDDIVNDGNRAVRIIDHLRARVTNKQQPAGLLDLNAVALEVIQFLTPELHKRSVSVKTAFAGGLPQVKADAIQLHQVILNLIINAAQAMEDTPLEPRELLIETFVNCSFVELGVRDCGSGFEAGMAERLFEPFFTTKSDGIGMGLTISRTIIESYGGRIWATSNADGGATFRFCLPHRSASP